MAAATKPSVARKQSGDRTPVPADSADDIDGVLFGLVWERCELTPRDRSLVTVASLLTSGRTAQLIQHLGLARRSGVTETELIELITHLAGYATGRKVMSAMAAAEKVFREPAGGRPEPVIAGRRAFDRRQGRRPAHGSEER